MRESTRKTKKLAISAMLTALGVVLLTAGSIFQTLDLTMAAIASLCVVLAMIELGSRSAWLIYIATSVLALILVPQLIVAEYILFAGLYPLIKSLAEHFGKLLSWVIKLLFANLSLTALLIVSRLFFSMPVESGWLVAATYVAVNITVVIFDIALTRLITFYYARLQTRLAPLFKGIK